MVIGVLVVHLRLPDSDSLKAKRRVVLSLKSKLKNRFNISVSETGLLDSLKESEIGICCVGNDAGHIDRQLAYIVNDIENNRSVEIINFSTERI